MDADKTFFETVKRMRQLQKEYFSTRSGSVLTKAKQAEREVDNLIKVRDQLTKGIGQQGRLI